MTNPYSSAPKGCWLALLSAGFLILAGCGGGSSGGGQSGPPGNGEPFEGRLTGTLTGPNGTSPVPGATVYIPDDGAAPLGFQARSQSVMASATECAEPPVTTLAWSCTDDAGRFGFDIDLPVGSEVEIRAFRGAWSLTKNVVLGTADAGVFAFPADPSEGAARIAVVTGAFDRIENVLAKMGMAEWEDWDGTWPLMVSSGTTPQEHRRLSPRAPTMNFQGYRRGDAAIARPGSTVTAANLNFGGFVPGTETFDLYDGLDDWAGWDDEWGDQPDFDPRDLSDYPSVEDLFRAASGQARARIFDYDIVYINCGADEPFEVTEWQDILESYVREGGILYVTDLSSPFVTEPFSDYVYLAGDGDDIDQLTARVQDQDLRTYLAGATCEGGSACITAGGDVTLYDFGGGWELLAPVEGMLGSHVQNLVTADVSAYMTYYGNSGNGSDGLTLSFSHGTGRVVFSSYHVAGMFGGSQSFTAQERILERLFWVTAGGQ